MREGTQSVKISFGKNRKQAAAGKKKTKFFKRRGVKITIRVLLSALVILGIVMFVRLKTGRKSEPVEAQTTSEVTRGDIYVTVTGSGTVSPIESYTLSPLITGKILECGYDKGESVEEGAVLYRFEDTEAQAKIKNAENSVKAAQLSLQRAEDAVRRAEKNIEDAKEDIEDIKKRMEKLTVKAPISGMVEELTAKEGSKVSGVLCRILDYNDISADVSFNTVQFGRIKTGDKASVGIAKLMTTVEGSVVKKYTAPHSGADGSVMYTVKVKLNKGLNLAAGTNVSVTVHTDSGDEESPSVGTLVYAEPQAVEAEESGEAVVINAENGNYVEKGSVIAVLKSEALEKELENANDAYRGSIDALQDAKDSREGAQSSLENAEAELETVKKAAEDYVLTSPVTGVVLEKYYKAGDTYGNEDEKRLMVVADMSKMVFSINIDELDISGISEGQQVTVTADALPGEVIMGTVTSVSRIGNSENGITGYPVEVTIDEPGNLMSGMNVTAEIDAGSASGVILAPASAIFQTDGLYYATVVATAPDGSEEEIQTMVTVGLHNNEFYEITSGLSEGDILRDSGIGADMGGNEYMYYG